MTNTVAFDPGYAKHLTSFINTIDYIYYEIGKFKNLGQKKFKFKSTYPQITKLIEQNIQFYLGCLLWAAYVSNQDGAELSGNHCYGLEYKEEIELQEINFLTAFIQNFDKDTKYYLNQKFEIEDWKKELLEVYKEFARINEGFTKSKVSNDIKLPKQIKKVSKSDIDKIYNVITKEVVVSGDFEKLYELKDLIL